MTFFCKFGLGKRQNWAKPMAYTLVLNMVNNLSEVERLPEFLDTIVEALGADPTLSFNLNLALEEAVVNVINYAYPQDGKQYSFTLTATCDNADATAGERQLTFTLSDSGVAFDPTQADEADTTLSAEERPIGGLGIFLVRQLMDDVTYSRVDGKNVLTMQKRF